MGKGEFGNHQVVSVWHIVYLVGFLANGFHMEDYRVLFLQGVQTEQMTDSLVNELVRHDFLSELCLLGETFFFFLGSQDVTVLYTFQREEHREEHRRGRQVVQICR